MSGGYSGQRSLMSDIGLMDYKARFYDPTIGRFIQPDSIIPGYANPQTLNRFSYVNNRPILLADPTGHRVACGIMGETCHDEGLPKPAQPWKTPRTSDYKPHDSVRPTDTATPTPVSCGSIISNACMTATAVQSTSVAGQCESGTAVCIDARPTPHPTTTPMFYETFRDEDFQDAASNALPSPWFVPNFTGFDANQVWNNVLGSLPAWGIPATNLSTLANQALNRVLGPATQGLGKAIQVLGLPTKPLPLVPPVIPIFGIIDNPMLPYRFGPPQYE